MADIVGRAAKLSPVILCGDEREISRLSPMVFNASPMWRFTDQLSTVHDEALSHLFIATTAWKTRDAQTLFANLLSPILQAGGKVYELDLSGGSVTQIDGLPSRFVM